MGVSQDKVKGAVKGVVKGGSRLPTLARSYEEAKYKLGLGCVAGVDEAG